MDSQSVELQLLILGGVSLGAAGLGLLGLLFGPKRGWTALGFLFASLLFAAAGTLYYLGLWTGYWASLIAVGGVSLALSAVRCRWLAAVTEWVLRQARNPRFQGLVLLALAPVAAAWFVYQTEIQMPPMDDHALSPGYLVDSSQLQEVVTVKALTDRGRPVPVHTVPNDPGMEEMLQGEQRVVRDQSLAQKQVRTEGPTHAYNCHGWVFTDGHFWVRGADVPTILEDNNYLPVSVPSPGDIIVYRDANGLVAHTGLVRTASDDGLVLIESKWGWMGRYIHRPQDQCYGTNWTYYHTDRGAHRVQGLGGETPRITTAAD